MSKNMEDEKSMLDMTVIILAKNEEKNIEKCVKSIKGAVKRIVLVDSYSDDNTVAIAKKLGCDIYKHEFKHYGAQFQYALDNCGIKTKWVFRLDADEEVSKEGLEEIKQLCEANEETDINGFVFRLHNTFLNKPMKHGFLPILEKLCIFKYGKAYMEDRYLGEQLVLTEGKSIKMKTASYHHDYKDLDFWTRKMNWYAQREAKDYLEHMDKTQELVALDTPTKIRRFIKYKVYYKLPSKTRVKLMYFYYHFLKFGFLDGREGYYRDFFMVYWYRMLVDAKIFEAQKSGVTIGETGAWR